MHSLLASSLAKRSVGIKHKKFPILKSESLQEGFAFGAKTPDTPNPKAAP